MIPRNLSPQAMFMNLAKNHVPRMRFSQGEDFRSWKAETLPAVINTLGTMSPAVPPNPELIVRWEEGGIGKRRYFIDVAPGLSAILQVNCPLDRPNGLLPVIQCWHGHGPFGKEPVMGNRGDKEVCAAIDDSNYDYGHQMAKLGFVTFAIDWMGCGDQNDSLKPHFLEAFAARDWCNLYYLHATMLGTTPLAMNLSHGRIATDFVLSLPECDPNRLGVMGLSGGGAMALWTALTEPRIKAVEIVCYSDLFALFGIRDINYCGSQITPGLFCLVDLPDLQGLLAPMPLLVDIGIHDRCFQLPNALECRRQVERIYAEAGASEYLHLDLFSGGHSWGANQSGRFFATYL